ncbi:MAG TPA: Asd/ArgC dimerization domain-containing protein [Thermoanaerobaculia bacterium]|nr:Asd/ArgC dimerization domain-containing protein [Thermoanaerobaculia bacterium]
MANPKHSSGYRLGIVNPLTLVGEEVKSILRARAFPSAKISLFDSTGQSGGALTQVGDEPAFVAPLSRDELEDLDLVFFCGPAEANRDWLTSVDDLGFVGIDLSQPSTAEDGKLVVAGINLENVDADDRLIVSPHPAAIPIALILHELANLSPIELCTATVVQPASEFGQAGVEELARQTLSILNVQSVPQQIFDRQLAFNLYPAPEGNEEFVIGQVRALTSPRIEIALLITQGTIFHGHTFSLFVRMKKAPGLDRIHEQLRRNPALALPEGDQSFGTVDAAGKDEVLIAEVRLDRAISNGLWIWAVCDNLRRSSALNAVLIAEKALFGTGMTN